MSVEQRIAFFFQKPYLCHRHLIYQAALSIHLSELDVYDVDDHRLILNSYNCRRPRFCRSGHDRFEEISCLWNR